MMVLRKATVAAIVGILGSAFAAWAVPTGSVTTSPFSSAPTLGLPWLVLLAVVLGGFTVVRLRRRTGILPVLAAVAIAATLASIGLTYATPSSVTIVIDDGDCWRTATNPYNPANNTVVKNECTNPIKVVSIAFTCDQVNDTLITGNTLSPCTVGTVLYTNRSCQLPSCPG